MNIAAGIVVYLLIYWTVLFTVLPWGNKAPDVPETGMAGSAPINPRIKEKFLATAVVAAVVWVVVALLIHYQIIDFRSIARDMAQEDLKQ